MNKMKSSKLPVIVIILSSFFLSFLFPAKEKQVNTYSKSSQRDPTIAMNKKTGSYIIVWNSFGQDGDREGIYAQFFSKNDIKIGNEFRVNSTTIGIQDKPSAAMNNQGNCTIVWASNKNDILLQDIYCLQINENGKKSKEFLVNTTTLKSQNCSDIAMDEKGNFVICWHSWDQDGSDRGIYAQRFKYDGTKLGKEFLVNTFTQNSQCYPSIAMTPDGRFIITWQSWCQENPEKLIDYGIYAQMFTPDGLRLGNEIHVNTTITGDQFYPEVAISDSGNFIITWTNWNSYDPNLGDKQTYGDIYCQRFDSKGNKIGNELFLNTTIVEYQWLSSILLNNDGSFVTCWGSWKQDGSREGIYIQFFSPEGTKRISEYQVNSYTGNYQWEPRLAGQNNDVVVVWSSFGQDGNDYGIFSRRVRLSDINK